MMEDVQTELVRGALAGMGTQPRPLAAALAFQASQVGVEYSERQLVERLAVGDPNDQMRLAWVQALSSWDFSAAETWNAGTEPNSRERRTLVYSRLGASPFLISVLEEYVPFLAAADRLVVIAPSHSGWSDQPHFGPGYYWTKYSDYLLRVRGWPGIVDLDKSTSEILGRLADPRQRDAWQSKGLVVGHVQSGKTANFTGVIAKAADAGYRLFIVLSGRTDILRHQTQRRLDKELLGRELVGDSYIGDPDWADFMHHGEEPHRLGYFDWERLTGPYGSDYMGLGPRIHALRFRSSSEAGSYAYERTPAKLIVLKKNSRVLARLATDIGRVRNHLLDVPAVVIDDESDEASINTRRPSPREERERTAVNHAITDLLGALPRAQYIGYTATPFANFFVDASDAADLFPKDFIIALKRPPGYMGASDFHDLDGEPASVSDSKRWRHVRDVVDSDGDFQNLPQAIDAYVLSGALKLWREAGTGRRFRHHTMLVHITQSVAVQDQLRDQVEETIDAAGYHGGPGIPRLRALWESDFRPRSDAWGGSLLHPATFDELLPYIGGCLARLESGPPRVRLVNGSTPEDTPDFDQGPIWKVLVGGNKLSRGYTVEGLTVSYYRRRSMTADTLMQMGRWCGFRAGYADLVRLYIGRHEPVNQRGGFVDLYLLFEAAVRDEQSFRMELERYALDIEPRITPAQVPPLVEAHLGLMPTARNKMFNAEPKSFNFSCAHVEKVRAPSAAADIEANEAAMRRLLSGVGLRTTHLSVPSSSLRVNAIIGMLEPSRVLEFLADYRWLEGAPALRRELEFARGDYGDPEIASWVLYAPQTARPEDTWNCEGQEFAVLRRSREGTGLAYGAYTGSADRQVSSLIAGLEQPVGATDALRELAHPRQAVLTFMPVRDFNYETTTSMGFALRFPDNDLPHRTVFGLRDPSAPDAVVVDVRPPNS